MLAYAALITGLGLGSMYGLLALGFHVTYAVSNTVNFAQGSTMMLGAVLCFTFWVTLGWPLALAIAASLVLSAAWSVFVERIAVRPVRAARLKCLADGDGRARHRARERGAVHLRQGSARHAGRISHDHLRAGRRHQGADLAAAHPGHRAAARRRDPPVLPAHALRQGAARRGAEPRRRAPDGHRHRSRRDRFVRAVRISSPASPAFWSRRCSRSHPRWARCSASRPSRSRSSAASTARGAWCSRA